VVSKKTNCAQSFPLANVPKWEQSTVMQTTTASTPETAIFSLLLTDSQILDRLGASELTVDGLVIGATVACEDEQMTVSERDRLVNVATSWERTVDSHTVAAAQSMPAYRMDGEFCVFPGGY